MDNSLTVLLARCASGDEHAIETLVARFQFHALGFATALLNDRSAAQDVVQESFVIALDRLESLRDPGAFPAWFRQILRTRVSRANRRRTECSLDDSLPLACDQPSIRERLDRQKLAEIVRNAVESLPAASRVTVRLYYFDEMKQTDIAGTLDLPLGTVKRRLHDARLTLRVMLAGLVEEPVQPTRSPDALRDGNDPQKSTRRC